MFDYDHDALLFHLASDPSETTDLAAAVAFYERLFGGVAAAPFDRGGATWVDVRIGSVKVSITDRACTALDLGRNQGFDHFALGTDDFDASLAHLVACGATFWAGPLTIETGQRIVFVQGPDNVKVEVMEPLD